VAPPEITTRDIWKGAAVFLLLQFIGLNLCILWPEIILVVPKLIYR
jgi:TRAP-type mannitol/chloroaromatic compound transport system permease large subunit